MYYYVVGAYDVHVVHEYLCGACVCAYVYSCGAYIYLCGARVINDVMMIDLRSYGARVLM